MHRVGTLLHAGGILHDAPLSKQTPDLLREVLAPKGCGARNLERTLPLLGSQRYVAFSSIASLMGPAGSANYAGANACLDAQAAQLSAAGAAPSCSSASCLLPHQESLVSTGP